MKTHLRAVAVASVLVSVPCCFFIAVNLYNGRVGGVLLFSALLGLVWGMRAFLRSGWRYALPASLAFVALLWVPLLIRSIGRVSFVLENRGMERADGYGSPLAFLMGVAIEQFFFIPPTIILVSGAITMLSGSPQARWLVPNEVQPSVPPDEPASAASPLRPVRG